MSNENIQYWYSSLNKHSARDFLRKCREENQRCPEKVRDLWNNFDFNFSGDEKWPIIEQVCFAAIDLNDQQLIKECLKLLDEKFTNSSRVKRLKIMAKLELRERYDDALNEYNDLIKLDESNSILYKRKISILISQNKINEAIKELTEYLKKFMNDTEAWLELSDLYIGEQEYAKAAFCIEELLISNPHNPLYHLRYADIQYTIGTLDSYELARSYYSQALKLNQNNLRALYGLILTCHCLNQHPKYSVVKRKENQKIANWAQDNIDKLYKENDADECQLKTIENLFNTLQLNSN